VAQDCVRRNGAALAGCPAAGEDYRRGRCGIVVPFAAGAATTAGPLLAAELTSAQRPGLCREKPAQHRRAWPPGPVANRQPMAPRCCGQHPTEFPVLLPSDSVPYKFRWIRFHRSPNAHLIRLAVHPKVLPSRSRSDRLAKEFPASDYGSAGLGSAPSYGPRAVRPTAAKIEMVHVPFAGLGPAHVRDGRQSDLVLTTVPVRQATGPRRHGPQPLNHPGGRDPLAARIVPTFREAGRAGEPFRCFFRIWLAPQARLNRSWRGCAHEVASYRQRTGVSNRLSTLG